jgi:hypothetical protein
MIKSIFKLRNFEDRLNDLLSSQQVGSAIEFVHQQVDPHIVFEGFCQALSDNYFFNRPSDLFELITIPLYQSELFTVNVNVFPANNSPNSASSIIHHHSEFLLSSKHLFGSGFSHIIFNEAKINTLPFDYSLINHKEGNQYTLLPFQYHLVFGCKTLSATIAIWISHDNFKFELTERINYMIMDNRIVGLTDTKFSSLLPNFVNEMDINHRKMSILSQFIIEYCNLDFYEIMGILNRYENSQLWKLSFHSHFSLSNKSIIKENSYLTTMGFQMTLKQVKRLLK